MNKTVKRAAAVLLAVCSAFMLFSCGDSSPSVMELDGAEITSAVYHYWASSAKANYLYSYEDVTDTAECWARDLGNGQTVAEYFDAVTLETVKENLVAIKLFDDYGLKITKSEKEGVDGYIGDIIKEYADGSRKLMNTVLSEYGIDINILKEIYLDETKTTKVFDYLYGDGGKTPLADKDYEDYYNANFVHFQLIYINDAYQYITDEDGNYVTDDSGVYKTEELDAAVKAEKEKLIAEVDEKLAAGEDFYSLYDEYSEMKDYENGFYYATNEAFGDEVFYKLTAAAVKAETGETVKVETDSGTCYIIKLDNDAAAWKDNANADFFDGFTDTVKEDAYRAKLREYFDDITADEEAIKEFSVTKVTPAYSF